MTPRDVWLICGEPLTDAADRGCTCNGWDPSPLRVSEALRRRASESPTPDVFAGMYTVIRVPTGPVLAIGSSAPHPDRADRDYRLSPAVTR